MLETHDASDRCLALARRYAVTVASGDAPDAPFVAQAAEFPLTCGVGETPAEAVAVLTEMLADTIEVLSADGRPVPEPLSTFTGILHLRVPKSLHQALVMRAATEGVSLNAEATQLLTRGLAAAGVAMPGQPTKRRAAAKP